MTSIRKTFSGASILATCLGFAASYTPAAALDVATRNAQLDRLSAEQQALFDETQINFGPLYFQDAKIDKVPWIAADGKSTTADKLDPAEAIISPFFIDPISIDDLFAEASGTAATQPTTQQATQPTTQPATQPATQPTSQPAPPSFSAQQYEQVLQKLAANKSRWGQNSIEILRMAKDAFGNMRFVYNPIAELPFSIIETLTHIYLFPSKYQAFDVGENAHAQDSEASEIRIRKDELAKVLRLESLVVNSHGYPVTYAPVLNLQEQLRKRTAQLIGFKQAAAVENSHLLHREAWKAYEHRDQGQLEFLKDKSGRPSNVLLYSDRQKHPLSKCNTQVWSKGCGEGIVYTPVARGKASRTRMLPLPPPQQRLVGYAPFNIDKLIMLLYPRNEAELSPKTMALLQELRGRYFEGRQDQEQTTRVFPLSDGCRARLRPHLPTRFVRGEKESQAGADLSNNWELHPDASAHTSAPAPPSRPSRPSTGGDF